MSALNPYPDYKDSGTHWMGDVPIDWKVASLRRFVDIVNGGTPSPDEANWGGAVQWATPVDLNAFDGMYVSETLRTLTEKGLSSGSNSVPAESVLLSTRAPIGYASVTLNEMAFNQGCKGLVPVRKEVSPKFLMYFLGASKAELWARGQGTTFLELSGASLGSVKLCVPSPSEQSAITSFLDRETAEVDAFIADQRELVVLLNERRNAVRTSILHDAALAAQVKPLKRAASVTVGIVVSPSAWYTDDGVPALRGTNVKEDSITLDDIVYLTEEGHRLHTKSALRHNDVVVVRTGQAGAAARIPLEMDGFNAIDLLVVKPATEVTGEFLTFVLNSTEVQEQVRAGSVGAIQGHFNVESLRNLNVPVPAMDAQVAAVNRWDIEREEIDAAIADANEAIELSKERRSALISAAVTGKIDVRNRITAELGAA